ncbi:MAG: TIGR00282 family metallophosphoesterase [Planctomycetes bacterium]|nr:TIGR00282 family metallophosphoesterase [Planctomycetota bacterium]
MEFRFLALGDVVGKPGRRAVGTLLPVLVREERIDFVVANGENAAWNGNGIGAGDARELREAGVGCITLGDHVWRQADIVPVLEEARGIVRPANLPPEAKGKGWLEFDLPSGETLAVVNLLGQVFMDPADCPFHAADRALAALSPRARFIVVDIHAEATSEKNAIARYLDGRVSAVFGTHTHVQTADERVLPGGTAYITDLGMTGPHDSILGRKVEPVVKKMRTSMHARFEVAERDLRLQGALVALEGGTGRAISIRRVEKRLESSHI